MRYAAAEKYEIIRLVEDSSLSVRRTLAQLGIGRSTSYGWLKRYQQGGMEALEDRKPSPRAPWNQLPQAQQNAIVELALDQNDPPGNWRSPTRTRKPVSYRNPRCIGC